MVATTITLTARQERFVDEYLVDLNATQAAIRAGYSAKSAHVEGSRLLTNAKWQRPFRLRSESVRRQPKLMQSMCFGNFTKLLKDAYRR